MQRNTVSNEFSQRNQLTIRSFSPEAARPQLAGGSLSWVPPRSAVFEAAAAVGGRLGYRAEVEEKRRLYLRSGGQEGRGFVLRLQLAGRVSESSLS